MNLRLPIPLTEVGNLLPPSWWHNDLPRIRMVEVVYDVVQAGFIRNLEDLLSQPKDRIVGINK